jgi:hypothetical protein
MHARRLSSLMLSLLVAAGCSRAPEAGPPDASPPPAGSTRSSLPSDADVARFLKEGPEPTLQALRPLDFWLHYKLMQASGIEQALGGEAQAIAALKALGNAYERKLRGAEADAPRLVPAAFTGEGMSSGLAGLGMGAFAGMMTGGMMSGAVSRMSDKELADVASHGPIKFGGDSGGANLQVGEDGSLTQTMAFDVNENGIHGKVKIKTHMDACPDPQGKVTVTLDVDSAMDVNDRPGTGGYVRTQFNYERYLDDDAQLISSSDGGASNMRIQMGGYENFQAQQLDLTVGHERGGKEIFAHHDESGFSIFRPEEVARAQQMIRSAELLNTLIAEVMLRGMNSRPPWEGGHCVRLDVASNPGKRNAIRPGTTFDIDARPRAKSDGASTGGTVTATLTGDNALQPASGKVPADARYRYAGPDRTDQSANIAFEARSKRGVGRATLEFDTRDRRAYRIRGGQNDFSADVVVCSLIEPFDIGSKVGIVMHMSGGEGGGSWKQSGSAAGVSWSGGGSYTLSLKEDGSGTLQASGTSSIATPAGRFSDAVSPVFTVTPAEADCN